MRFKFRGWMTMALAVTAVALAGPLPTTQGGPTLTLKASETGNLGVLNAPGSGNIFIVDNGPQDSSPLVTGTLTLGSALIPLTFGDFSVFGSISISNAQDGPLAISSLNTSSLQVINNDPTGAAHSITLDISDIGFMFPPSPLLVQASASGGFVVNPTAPGGTTISGSSATAKAWVDSTNTLFGTQTLVLNQSQSFGAVLNGPFSFTNSISNFSYSPSYSMSVELAFTVAGNSRLNNRGNVINAVSAIPEPATIIQAGLAVVLLAGYGVRRRQRKPLDSSVG